jgi:hypothetical protein
MARARSSPGGIVPVRCGLYRNLLMSAVALSRSLRNLSTALVTCVSSGGPVNASRLACHQVSRS